MNDFSAGNRMPMPDPGTGADHLAPPVTHGEAMPTGQPAPPNVPTHSMQSFGSDPQPPARQWYQKKRWIGGGAFGLVMAITAINGAVSEPVEVAQQTPEIQQEQVVETTVEQTPNELAFAEPTQEELAVETPAVADTIESEGQTQTTVEVVEPAVTEEEILDALAIQIIREKFPLIALPLSTGDITENDVADLAVGVCELARASETADQFTLANSFLWDSLEPEVQILFNSSFGDYSEFTGTSIGWKCADEGVRLGF